MMRVDGDWRKDSGKREDESAEEAKEWGLQNPGRLLKKFHDLQLHLKIITINTHPVVKTVRIY